MTTSYLARARDLAEQIDRHGIAVGENPVSEDSIRLLRDAELFAVMTPREVGGLELPLADILDICAEVSRADPSTGWCHMAVVVSVAYFGAYTDKATVERMFARGVPLVAGQFAPNGLGVREGDNYRVSGDYQFGSGVLFSDYIGLGMVTDDAEPQMVGSCVPKEQVKFSGNWDVMGLQSTASVDYSIRDAVVPAGATFDILTPEVHRGGDVYRLGILPLTAIGHAGFSLGVARRALDEALRIATAGKHRMGHGSKLSDSDHFLLAITHAESRFRAANAWLHQMVARAEDSVRDGGAVDNVLCNELRQATVFLSRESADIVRECYLHSGTAALREGPLARCFRDVHASTQHFFAGQAGTLDMGRDLLAAATLATDAE